MDLSVTSRIVWVPVLVPVPTGLLVRKEGWTTTEKKKAADQGIEQGMKQSQSCLKMSTEHKKQAVHDKLNAPNTIKLQ